MPIEYRVDKERQVLVAEVTGDVADADLLAYGRALKEDPGAQAAGHELVDLRGVGNNPSVTAEGVRALAEFWRAAYDRIAGVRLAIVAGSDVSYGMARMYQSYRADGPDEIRIFRDADEAWAWVTQRDRPARGE